MISGLQKRVLDRRPVDGQSDTIGNDELDEQPIAAGGRRPSRATSQPPPERDLGLGSMSIPVRRRVQLVLTCAAQYTVVDETGTR